MKIYTVKDSDVLHVVIDDKVKHIIERTILSDNPAEPYTNENCLWILITKSNRKSKPYEFDGYFEGRIYEYVYCKFLD